MENATIPKIRLSLHPRQLEAFQTIATELLYGGAAGGGKALAVDTPIPTPSNWSTMGQLRVGDIIFDGDTNPTCIVATSPIMEDRPCYRLTFSDGSEIVADADHLWSTLRRGRDDSWEVNSTFKIFHTIADNYLVLSYPGSARFILITSCERVPSVPVRCIQVDSPCSTFLCGSEMIVTHNSHLVRVALVSWCVDIPGLQCYLFRRIFDDLIKNHYEGPTGFREMLAPWREAKLITITDKTEVKFWNGSRIFLCHCQYEESIEKYRGPEMHVLAIEEATQFSEYMLRFLRSRVRMTGVAVPEELQGRFPRMMMTSNPGGVGHHYLKEGFVDPGPYDVTRMPPKEGGMLRQFIPARLDDNPSLGLDYEDQLSGLGSPQLVRALRDGDWSVVEGAFFSEFSESRHVLTPFAIPEHWVKFRCFDWGSAKPFYVGWHAVSDGSCVKCNGRNECEGGRSCQTYPHGSLLLYREWYGGERNVGLKLRVSAVAEGIKSREAKSERIAYSVADPAVFKADGGPSHAEAFADAGIRWLPGDNSRVAGWTQFRDRLIGDDDGHPMWFCFSSCREIIRTLPAMQHDRVKPEDIDSDSDDHCLDSCRYGLMSRPWVRKQPKRELDRQVQSFTVKNIIDSHLRNRSRRR